MTTTPERPRLTAEEMPVRRKEIAALREQKGREKEALVLARSTREDAMSLGWHEDVVELYWEECLTAKHMLMGNPGDLLAHSLLRTAAISADAYIEKHNVESKRPRSQRFLGEVEMLGGEYDEAVYHFTEGINLFEDSKDSAERVNALELRGFLAEALIRSDELGDGLYEGFSVLKDFDKDEGAELKEKDYYTWAVWKSGVVIKMWNAVIDDGGILTEEQLKLLRELDKVEEMIELAPRNVSGDFSYRKEEIKRIRKRLVEANIPQ